MQAILHLINEMSPYLLLGFFLAGLMHAFIPGRYYTHYLSRPTLRSVVNAALFGIPLPLCSCGVIPTAMSLRKEGASKGAVASFLIATPQTGVDSIIATFSLMGVPFAVIRPVAALVTAVFGGWLVNTAEQSLTATPCPTEGEDQTHSLTPSHKEREEASSRLWPRFLEALDYAFVDMMEDIGKWLVIGLVVAGLITVLVPDSAFAIFQGNTWASMLLVLCIAIPMYLCATGSIPIAVALMLKGLTPGAGLVLLMAGPACNMASILVIRKVMGTRTLATYLASIVIGAVGFGFLIDWLQFSGTVDFLASLTASAACCAEGDSWFAWASTAVLAALLINALVLPRLGLRKAHECHCHDHCGCEDDHCNCESDDHCAAGSEMSPCASGVSPSPSATYRIKGMTCNHCRAAAERAIAEVPGVERVTVTLQDGVAEVCGTASREAISDALEAVGFSLA